MDIEPKTFISRPFLRSLWALDYEIYKDSEQEQKIIKVLKSWSKRSDLKETSAESAFIDTFFKDLWGYTQSGQGSEKAFSLYPKYPVKGGGLKGGTGYADLAIGWFNHDDVPPIPQILCEFKDIKSNLDAPQKSRKNNPRSPVKQCLDYLSASRRELFGNEGVLPTWGIVTDMNEFRLYWFDRAPRQYFRFVIRPMDLFQGRGLLDDGEKARFDRFLFWKIFHSETLLTTGGRSKLEQLIARQWVTEREIENTFYAEYKDFREKLYKALLEHNPGFPGTKGRLVRIAQKILDRFIFIFFCEDMGQALSFPPQVLRDLLRSRANDEYFNANGYNLWAEMIGLFKSMNEGKPFGGKKVNQFNGGLFADDPEMESLVLPNSIFCRKGQGQNAATLNADKDTILYLSAAYNYASDMGEGLKVATDMDEDPAKALKSDPSRSLGLYMLGRIFEQSITELEILEAEVEGLPSINKESKRKRDGVYYTPEWVVERIVNETIGSKLNEIKLECDWPQKGLPAIKALDKYLERLKEFKVVDPACGSGAFLIVVLRFLLDEWHTLLTLRKEVANKAILVDDIDLIKNILRNNLYGVDINPASVEIARLALWLHTASGKQPLSSLDHTILDGNSLIGEEFYKGQVDLRFYDESQKERINTFEWEEKFPEVFEKGGFDAVVSNPPYVKLQNFRKVHPDMAEFLKTDRFGRATYKSTQTGNFDLYLPFIEKGLWLLNENGRLGFIASSLWVVNEYGEGLRGLIEETKQLYGWIDFKAFQVFEEATTYTALQFFAKKPNKNIKVYSAPNGKIPDDPWAGKDSLLPYEKLKFGDRWLILTGEERGLIDKLYESCDRLDASNVTTNIFVGIQTSADSIYHLERLAEGKYKCDPQGKEAISYEVEVEDEIMKPLVSGAEAKRYITSNIRTYLLFPYAQTIDGISLIDKKTFEKKYPKAWKYLKSYEKELRSRENFKMDRDDGWWAYNYPKNLDKQEMPKLIVPRLVCDLHCSVDAGGQVYLDNVDVGGISASSDKNLYFLSGVLNSPVANFVFKRISKPFRGEYRSANKQFIAPLPIPKARNKEHNRVSSHARELESLYVLRCDTLEKLRRRMESVKLKSHPETFLFPKLKRVKDYLEELPKNLKDSERKAWAKEKYEEDLLGRYDEIAAWLHPAASLDATFQDGELRFFIDGMPVLESIFLDEKEGAFILAQWKVLAHTFSITEKRTGKKLCDSLRKSIVTDNHALIAQIMELESELTKIEKDIEKKEKEINALIYKLYKLTDKEIELVEKMA